MREGKFNILNGSNGALLREASATQQDSIYLGNFLRGGATGILIKDRYRSWSVYNTDLQLQWSGKGNLGHYPMSYDFNGDGTEEIIIGFSMYSFNKELWSVKLTHHNDATAVADMDGDGRPEIAIASSGDAVLLNPRGEVLWVKRLGHAQHAIIGSFDWNTPSRKQAVFVDRAANGRIHAYDKAGNELWNLPPQGRITMAMSVKGWTGHRGEDLVLLSRRQAGPPVLVDGHGKIVAELPFPPAKFASTEGLQNKNKTYDKYYVQHYDLLGDGREEIVVYDKNELWIYSNPSEAPANINVSEGFPNRRAYNNTFYTGVQ